MATNIFENIISGIAKVFYPLETFQSKKQVTAFFKQLGYELPDDQLFGEITGIVTTFEQLKSTIDLFTNAGSAEAKWKAIQEILKSVEALSGQWNSTLNEIKASVSGVPDFINNSNIDELPRRLVDYLVIDHCRQYHKRLYAILLLVGIFDEIKMPADVSKFQPAFLLRQIRPELLSLYFTKAKDIPELVYKWQSAFEPALLIKRLGVLANAYFLPGGFYSQSEKTRVALQNTTEGLDELRTPIFSKPILPSTVTQFGISIGPVEQNADGKPGFAIIPFFSGGTSFDFNIGGRFDVKFAASVDIDAGVGVIVRPDKGVQIFENLFSAPNNAGEISITLDLEEKEGGAEMILMGAAGRSRLSMEGLHINLFINNDDAGVSAGVKKLRLFLTGKDGDGFINKILNNREINGEAALDISFSRTKGFHFEGSGGFELKLPLHISLGFVDIQGLTLAIKIKGGDVMIESGADIRFTLGPLVGIINNMGVSSTFSFPAGGGNLSFANLDFGFKPPEGIGLAIDAGGFKGGGILNFNPNNKEYFGAMELEFKDLFSIKAFAIINTRMPDGSDDFSLLIIITAEFSPIQLGFGFTLNGVGGLFGYNRTMKLDVLKEGIKTNALESTLFPQNIVANINRIVSDIKQVFPPQHGRFIICPMGKLGWGTPTLITLEMGILIEIPATGFAILGVLKALLPNADAPLLKLQVNFVGIIDFENKNISFDAMLFDSRLLTFTISGQMALRIAWGDRPVFILSVGGFHPSFKEIPVDLQKMQRITISLLNEKDARISIQSYFAITSNTAQFGARAELYAQEGGFNIYGFIGYDVLFQFNPFKFTADFSAGIALRRHSSVIMSIKVSGELSGPGYWDAHGEASISFFFFSVSVSFHKSWGNSGNTSVIEKADVFTLLENEINDSRNWKAAIPVNNKLHVSIRKIEASGDVTAIHPFGILTFSERLVPLEMDINKFGNQVPKDANNFKIKTTDSALVTTPVTEQFAPANFIKMSDEDKLARPSFEQMKSGFEITGSSALSVPSENVIKAVDYEFSYLGRPAKHKYQYPKPLFQANLKGSAVSQSALSFVNNRISINAPEAVYILEEQFAVANIADMKLHSSKMAAGSYTEAVQFYNTLVKEKPELKNKLQILSQYELNLN
jgi:hypothetical protein